MPRQILTSANNPLHIAALPAGTGGGLIGVTFAPGKKQPNSVSGHHDRDFGADLDQIAAWNAAIVVTLMEPQELAAVAIPHLGAEVRRRHMEWHHWPIIDVSTPDPAFDAAWPERSAKLRTVLANGGRVLIHCRGGLGRSGMLAARLLVESGTTAPAAIAAVRAARPGAVETRAQERWVAAGRPLPLPKPSTTPEDRAVGAMLAQKPSQSLFRRIGARPTLAAAAGFHRRLHLHRNRQPARGGKGLEATRLQIRQRLAQQPGKIFGRFGLHPGGDFFAEQFEEKFSHLSAPPPARLHSRLWPVCAPARYSWRVRSR